MKVNSPSVISIKKIFSIILENVDYGINVQDVNGNVIYANSRSAYLLGYTSSDEFIHKSRSDMLKKHVLYNENGNKLSIHELPAHQVALTKQFQKMIVRFLYKPSGKEMWALINAIPIFDGRNKLKYIVNTFQDITEEKNQQVTTEHFIAIGSHELKTPLTGIKALNQLVHKKIVQNKLRESLQFVHKIDKKTDELTKIINDFLDIEKIKIGQLDMSSNVFDYYDFIHEVTSDFQRISESHHITIQDDGHVNVIADKQRLTEVVMNLLRNAKKYSPKSDNIIIRYTRNDTRITTSIQDFGIGIDKKDYERIFEPFCRKYDKRAGKIEGIGLGLHIASKIIQHHGGTIWVESQPKKGSTFFFTLPIHPLKKESKYDF